MKEKFFQCADCGNSMRSEKELRDHEGICIQNGKTAKERFETKKRLEKEKRSSVIQGI